MQLVLFSPASQSEKIPGRKVIVNCAYNLPVLSKSQLHLDPVSNIKA